MERDEDGCVQLESTVVGKKCAMGISGIAMMGLVRFHKVGGLKTYWVPGCTVNRVVVGVSVNVRNAKHAFYGNVVPEGA